MLEIQPKFLKLKQSFGFLKFKIKSENKNTFLKRTMFHHCRIIFRTMFLFIPKSFAFFL